MKTDELTVNGIKYLVKIHFENRKNCRVSIRKKAVNIRIPSFLSKEEKADQLNRMKTWAGKKLLENPEKFKPEPQKEYKNEDILKIGDEEYSLKIKLKDKKSSSAALNSNTIQLVISDNLSKEEQNNHISTLISRCIGSKRLPKLQVKVKGLNKKHFNQNINKIFFKHNKSNWGSCSRAGNINISTRLLFAPDDVLEYVCIHELAHLLEHNHSKKFWTLVETAMPEYKEKKRWLKENGDICKF
jgi:hypothetical protein